MKYSDGVYEKAKNTLCRFRNEDEEEYKSRYNKAISAAPEIEKLMQVLNNSHFEFMKLIGKNGFNSSDIVNQIRKKNNETEQLIAELLTTCGFPADYLKRTYHCRKCLDSGYHDGKRCECFDDLLKKYAIEEINGMCSIKLHDFSEFRLENYPVKLDNGTEPRKRMEKIYAGCRLYCDRFRKDSASFLFLGGTGLGKTFISACITNELIKKGVNVIFVSVLNLIRQIESEHFGRCEDKNTLDAALSCDLLILDDLGTEFQTPFCDTTLYEIINGRLNMGLPTIVSTNLNVQEINGKYNERMVSRLTGSFKPMIFLGIDMRQSLR